MAKSPRALAFVLVGLMAAAVCLYTVVVPSTNPSCGVRCSAAISVGFGLATVGLWLWAIAVAIIDVVDSTHH